MVVRGIARLGPLRSAAMFLCVEVAVFGRFSPLRWPARTLWARRIARLRPHFEPDFYLQQVRSPARRRLAARDPLLHYLVAGWREHKAPSRRFEPRFVRDDLFPGRVSGEPLGYFLDVAGGETLPQNEAEAAGPAASPAISLPASPAASRLPPTVRAGRRALIFHHARGGGSSKFLAIFESRLRADNIEPVRLRAVLGCGHLVVWPGGEGTGDRVFDLAADADAFLAQVADAAIDIVVVSHVVDFTIDLFGLVGRCVAATGAALWVILHDYVAICPRVNLVDAWHRPCRGAAPAVCGACVAEGGGEIGAADPTRWRRDFAGFLARADRILAPSTDAGRRLARATGLAVEAWQPESDDGHPPPRRPALRNGDRLRVAVLGSLNHAKGSRVVLRLAERQRARNAPLRFTVFGASDITRRLRRRGVSVRGRFADRDLLGLLAADLPHLVLLPAIWPETWSFVLSHALALGLPVAAFAHGAQHERLRDLGRTDLVLPVEWIDEPDLVLDTLLAFRDGLPAADGGRERPRQEPAGRPVATGIDR